MKQVIDHWAAVAFCAFISLIAICVAVFSGEESWWYPAFVAFLPMCFFFVGRATSEMHREIRELRQRVGELEQKRVD